jgi:hypothetical protein
VLDGSNICLSQARHKAPSAPNGAVHAQSREKSPSVPCCRQSPSTQFDDITTLRQECELPLESGTPCDARPTASTTLGQTSRSPVDDGSPGGVLRSINGVDAFHDRPTIATFRCR